MTSLSSLHTGQAVIVSGAAGEVRGRVLHVAAPRELPPIDSFDAGQVREILQVWGVQQIALIEHPYAGDTLSFFALGNGRGGWRDLHANELTITTDLQGTFEVRP